MNFIITESRLHEYINSYIDKILNSKDCYRSMGFILVDDPWGDRGNDDRDVVIEFDESDGNLWISDKVLSIFNSLFNLSYEEGYKMIAKRVEDNFNVKVFKFKDKPVE